MDTIFALASAPGRAGVAVLRVSGDRAWDACRSLTGGVPEVRRASLRKLRDGSDLIDEALVLIFDSEQSFTGEKCVEFQIHGSPAVISRLLAFLAELDGFRLAEPGEFSRRALENDRMDLTRIEGLSDLLEAETEAQRKQAMRTFAGELRSQAESWREKLLRAVALVEVSIDFADEDVPVDVGPEVSELVRGLISDFREEIAGVDSAEQLRNGFEVAIVGPPNSGKSTLLNRLAGRDAAITSEFAGTTRDVIEVRMDIEGLPVTILDTAGLRETEDLVEAIGVQRARERAMAADIRLIMGTGDLGIELLPGDVLIAGKSDLGVIGEGLPISGLTGAGLEDLLKRIQSTLADRVSETRTATHIRHARALSVAVSALEEAENWLCLSAGAEELVAESIRTAIRSVDALVGRIGVEDILGEIFSSFCIGK